MTKFYPFKGNIFQPILFDLNFAAFCFQNIVCLLNKHNYFGYQIWFSTESLFRYSLFFSKENGISVCSRENRLNKFKARHKTDHTVSILNWINFQNFHFKHLSLQLNNIMPIQRCNGIVFANFLVYCSHLYWIETKKNEYEKISFSYW